MPTYVYKREDGTFFEIDQGIYDDTLTTCPTTDQPVIRVPQAFGSMRLGQGFYKEAKRVAKEGQSGAPEPSPTT